MPFEPKPKYAAKRPVRLTLPISVAYDLDKFEQALANLAHTMDRVGASDCSARSLCLREFIVDPASLQVREAIGEL